VVVLADLELEGALAPGIVHAAPGARGLVFLFALGERAPWRLLATRPRPEADPVPAFGQPGPGVPVGDLQTLLDGAGFELRIADAPWSARVPLQHRLAERYRSGRLFVAGDAAHAHSPAGGQGMNLGIQDATNLGWKLGFAARSCRPAAASEALLGSYAHERRPVARRVLALTHALFWAEAGTGPLASLGRRSVGWCGATVVPPLLRRRRLLAQGVRTLSQLRLRYASSPISTEGGAPGGLPQLGSRLPDRTVMTAGGPVRLHALLATPGVHVIVGPEGEVPAELGDRVTVHRLTDGSGAEALGVRPDGYVGFRSGVGDQAGLGRWLDLVNATSRTGGSVHGAAPRSVARSRTAAPPSA
jgi:hypothetical protein